MPKFGNKFNFLPGIIIAWLNIIIYVIAGFSIVTGFVLGIFNVTDENAEQVMLRHDQIIAVHEPLYSVLCKCYFCGRQLGNLGKK